MPLDPILRRNFDDPDRASAQDAAIASATGTTEAHLARYDADQRSFGGRYVSADLFKETFDHYKASKDARNRYNAPTHNAAAVLSAEQFRRQLVRPDEPGRNEAIFLTGIPGAGKTSSVLYAGFPANAKLVFEGQMVRAESSIPKLNDALLAGLRPVIVAVHARPEDALRNTLQRFAEEGRGAGIGVMADIQGGLPSGLAAIRAYFGSTVELRVFDVRNRLAPLDLKGWDNLHVLESEGNRERIHYRLRAELDRLRATGRLGDEAERQALGRAPGPVLGRVEQAGHGGHGADGERRGSPALDRQQAFLTLPPDQSARLYPDLARAHAALARLDQHLVNSGATERVRSEAMTAAKNEMALRIGRGAVFELPGARASKPPDRER